MATKASVKKSKFDFKKEILYPTCIAFAFILICAFFVAYFIGFNVAETRDVYYAYYNDSGALLNSGKEWEIGQLVAVSIGTVLGVFLFCASIFVIGCLTKEGYSKIIARIIHFIGTEIAFFFFILVLSGMVSETQSSFLLIVIIMLLVAILYFVLLGLKTLLSKPLKAIGKKLSGVYFKYVGPAFVIFTAAVFVSVICCMVAEPVVKINIEERVFEGTSNSNFYDKWETLVTPLAFTLQNLLRYLFSAAVLMCSVAVFKTKINPAAKWIFNFLICTSGFFVIWYAQMPFFFEVDSAKLTSIIVYFAAYVVCAVIAAICMNVLRRKKDEKDEYISQFSGRRGRKKREESTLFGDVEE